MNLAEPPIDNVTSLRVPPHSVEAEQSVLGALLLDNAAVTRIPELSPEHCYRPEHRAILATILRLLGAGKAADPVTVRAAGDHDRHYLEALSLSVPTSKNIERYAAIVRGRATLRGIIAAADEAAAAAFAGGDDADEIADRAAAAMAAVQTRTVTRPRSLAEIAVQRTAYYEAVERGDLKPGWPTHIPALDAMLNGGFRAGGLYILAARPGVGKSSLSLSMLTTLAAQGLPGLLLSLEMPADEVADRAVAHAGRIPYSNLLHGQLAHGGWERAAEALEGLARLPVSVDDQPGLTLAEIKAKARAVPGLKVLVLDYLQLCAGRDQRENRNSQIEEITRGLKALAKSMGISVLALSQLNRAVEQRGNKRPTLADLRDSGSIEQDADVVMFLWPAREVGGSQLVGMAVEKNRQGARGSLALDFHGATQRWGESTEPLELAARPRKQESFE